MRRDLRPNALILRIQPDEGISLEFGAKVPGEKFHVRSVAMDFTYAEAFAGSEAADGYERLIHDAMVGDATSLHPRRTRSSRPGASSIPT